MTGVCVCHRVVEFASRSEMKRALDKLDNSELQGRRIKLVEDKSARKRRKRFVHRLILIHYRPAIYMVNVGSKKTPLRLKMLAKQHNY